jgi:hypothetical protein
LVGLPELTSDLTYTCTLSKDVMAEIVAWELVLHVSDKLCRAIYSGVNLLDIAAARALYFMRHAWLRQL